MSFDEKIKKSLRQLACAEPGAHIKLIVALIRANKLLDYCNNHDEPLGPLSPLNAKCADCSNTIKWSNCSYCSRHHNCKCPGPYLDNDWVTKNNRYASYVEDRGHLTPILVYSCNQYREHLINKGLLNDEAEI